MFRAARLYLLVCGLLVCAWQCFAQMGPVGQIAAFPPKQPAPSGGGCSQATTFLARTSGLSGTETSAYTTMICGMVTDGTYSLFDALYIFATNTTTTANLNLVSTSFGLTCSNAPTFTADRGYTGNAFNTFCDPSYIPSTNGVQLTKNAAHFGFCVLNSRASGAPYQEVGTSDGTNQIDSEPLAPFTSYNINDNNFNAPTVTANVQGTWIFTRTNSTTVNGYLAGSSVISNSSTASAALPTADIYILAQNISGTPTDITGDQLGAAFWGNALTATQAANVTSRISAFITAVGGSGC